MMKEWMGLVSPSANDIDMSRPINWSDPINRSLVGYWAAFANRSGTFWPNLVRPQMPGVPSGGTAMATGPTIGQAWSFDGTDDILEVADHRSISFGDGAGNDRPFSITAIINHNEDSWYFPILSKDQVGTNLFREWAFYTYLGQPALSLYTNDGGNRICRTASSNVAPSGQTHVITGTYDGSKSVGGIKVYCGGVRVDDANDNQGSYTGMPNTASPLHSGFLYYAFGTGKIASLRIDARELTAAEVSRLARQPWAGLNVRRTRRTIANVVTASSTYFPYYLHTNTSFGAFGLGHTTGLIAS